MKNIRSFREFEALTEAKKFYTTKDIVKMAKNAGDIVIDAKYAIEDLGVAYGNKVPSTELDRVLTQYDLELEDLNEGRKKIQLKRKYGERSAVTAGKRAPVRDRILGKIAESEEGRMSRSSLQAFIASTNEDSGRKTTFSWVRKNSRYFKTVKESGTTYYKLSMYGKRALKRGNLNESESLNEGQFSWLTQDGGTQIGSERKNTITVYMFDDKGNKWEERSYEGYGEFGGKDYFDLLAEMNGYSQEDAKSKSRKIGEDLREIGIDLMYDKGIKPKNGGKVLFPALVSNKNYNWKRHDFTKQPEYDPNQGWYTEDYGW